MWRSKSRSSCKYAGVVSRTFIFSMLFNSFHMKIAFRQRGVKPSAANISFCDGFQCFSPILCSNDALTKPQGMSVTNVFFVWRASPISALSPARVTAKRNRLGSAPGRQLPWATDFKTSVGAVRCRATGCGWPGPFPKEMRRFHI